MAHPQIPDGTRSRAQTSRDRFHPHPSFLSPLPRVSPGLNLFCPCLASLSATASPTEQRKGGGKKTSSPYFFLSFLPRFLCRACPVLPLLNNVSFSSIITFCFKLLLSIFSSFPFLFLFLCVFYLCLFGSSQRGGKTSEK